jgi:hypothetical protein
MAMTSKENVAVSLGLIINDVVNKRKDKKNYRNKKIFCMKKRKSPLFGGNLRYFHTIL